MCFILSKNALKEGAGYYSQMGKRRVRVYFDGTYVGAFNQRMHHYRHSRVNRKLTLTTEAIQSLVPCFLTDVDIQRALPWFLKTLGQRLPAANETMDFAELGSFAEHIAALVMLKFVNDNIYYRAVEEMQTALSQRIVVE
jgi:hypothetical protein